MKTGHIICMVAAWCAGAARAGAEPSLTIYNQGFAVVRDTLSLDLKHGVNTIEYLGAAATLDPDSVMLRDPAGRFAIRVLEQNFRADPVSQELLLSLSEGKTLDFLVQKTDGEQQIVQGRVVRATYAPPSRLNLSGRGGHDAGGARGAPLVDVDGKLRFGLPGLPLFPALPDDSILKPTLSLVLESESDGKLEAELTYLANGLAWKADYNLISPEFGDALELGGWVTMDNQSGKTFVDARIKLMAGDVSRIQTGVARGEFAKAARVDAEGRPAVEEKPFEEFHLYTVQRPTTLRDKETKQIEFVRASGIESTRVYVYDGVRIDWARIRSYDPESLRSDRSFGTQSNTKVGVIREFRNSEANHLGIPLPAGKMRFYRRDADGRLEFVGENLIDHSPANETIRAYLGDAFDIVGEHRRTDFKGSNDSRFVDESFEIKLRNHKKDPVQVKVVEHLLRWTNWEITQKSNTFLKTDAQTVEFLVQVKPEEEKSLTYTVHYSW